MSYGRTAAFLEQEVPLEKRIRHVQQVATRIDGELGDEQWSFIEGCSQEWEGLPEPAEPLIVGIDGGSVHAREGQNRKAGFFEIIVGKSMTGEQPSKRFGFVNCTCPGLVSSVKGKGRVKGDSVDQFFSRSSFPLKIHPLLVPPAHVALIHWMFQRWPHHFFIFLDGTNTGPVKPKESTYSHPFLHACFLDPKHTKPLPSWPPPINSIKKPLAGKHSNTALTNV